MNNKIYYPLLIIIAITFNSCFAVIGSAIRLGFKLGVYSVFIIIGVIIWVIYKRGKNMR